MLQIRKQQIAVFEEVAWIEAVNRAVSFIQSELPEECASLESKIVKALCEKSLRVAVGYNMGSETDCWAYVYAVFVLGEDFEIDPNHDWALEILSSDMVDKSEPFWNVLLEKLEQRANL